MDLIWIIFWVLTGIVIGFAIAFYLQKSRYTADLIRLETQYEDLKNDFEFLKQENTRIKTENEELKAYSNRIEKEQLQRLSEKEKEIEVLKSKMIYQQENFNKELNLWKEKLESFQKQARENEEKLKETFENLSNRILEETGKKFTEENTKQIKQIIEPFKEQLHLFKNKVEETDKHQYGRLQALSEQIKNLQQLNKQMSEEALNLTKALKGDSKVMGDFGEINLKRILEISGLEEGREFKTQQSFAQSEHERKQYRPDVIVYLPENKVLIIDAKVSLKHYTDYINSEDETERKQLLQLHLLSVKNHIKELAAKNYHTIVALQGKTPEFVLMFIPLEPAFGLALKADPGIYELALRSNVVMVTPSTLLATLKVVESLWRTERQHKNMQEIIRQAGDLYDKFVGFTEDLIQMGKKLNEAKNHYDASMNKLAQGRGNLVKRVENIRKLGLTPKKRLNENLLRRASDDSEELAR